MPGEDPFRPPGLEFPFDAGHNPQFDGVPTDPGADQQVNLQSVANPVFHRRIDQRLGAGGVPVGNLGIDFRKSVETL